MVGQVNRRVKRIVAYIIIFLLSTSVRLTAQFDRSQFVKQFYKKDARGKLKALNALNPADLEVVYPFIEDTLEKVKRDVESDESGSYGDLKFQFDQLTSTRELSHQNTAQGIYILEKALRSSATNIDDSLSGMVNLKAAYVRIRNINKALELQNLIETKWNRKSENMSIDQGVRKSYLFHLLGLHQEAINELRKEYFIDSEKKDTLLLVNFHNDLGVYYNQENEADSAMFHLKKAKIYLAKVKVKESRLNPINYKFYSGLVDGNLGLSYYLKGNYTEAIPLLRTDAIVSRITTNYLSSFNAYLILTKCYLDLKNKKLSKLFLDTTQSILYAHLNGVALKEKLLPVKADYYLLVQDYKNATETFRDYFQLKDSIQLSEKEIRSVNEGLSYKISQTELANQELDKQMKEAQLREAKEKIFRISLLAALLILLTIIFFLFINNRRIKMREKQLSLKNLQIQSQNTQIEHTLKEKEALIKEIHHRVKNNLQIINSMLNLQIDKIGDEKTENIFLGAKQRINAIALTHQMLYQKTTISEVNLGEYIEMLVKQIGETMARNQIQIETNITSTDQKLEIDGAVPLGLIINEIITNSFKHAFKGRQEGKIHVSLLDNDDSLIIKISDNGIGLPENFKKSDKLNLGMELVLILIEQLDTELIIESENGSTFMFRIKKNKHKLRAY